MMRIALFLGTNLAILALISITFRLLGIDGLLMRNGVDLDINALLVYSAVIGFSGSLISLFISKCGFPAGASFAQTGAGLNLLVDKR